MKIKGIVTLAILLVAALLVLPATAVAETFTSDENGLTLDYPDTYVEQAPYAPYLIIINGPQRIPVVRLAMVTEADSLESVAEYALIEAGGEEITVTDPHEVTLADGKTKATEFVVSYLALGQYDMKGVGLYVDKGEKKFLATAVFVKGGYNKYLDKLKELAYGLKFK